ncbi:MAG: hypothetical protein U0Z74_03040 [Romboutsia timonensis]
MKEYILIATALLNIDVMGKLMDNTSLTGAIITLPSPINHVFNSYIIKVY